MAPIVLRLPLVYGPGVKGNFAALLDEVARARPLPLGAIRNRRSVLFVGNLVEAIDAALDAPAPPTGVHFVTDAESVSVPALVTAIGKALDIPVRLKAVPVRLLVFAGQVTGRTRIDRASRRHAGSRSDVVHRRDRLAAAVHRLPRASPRPRAGGGCGTRFDGTGRLAPGSRAPSGLASAACARLAIIEASSHGEPR